MHLVIQTKDGVVALSQSNTNVYRFRDKPEVDHAYYQIGEEHFYVFGCPDLLADCETCGFTVITASVPTHTDEQAYANWLDQTAEVLNDELEAL